MRVIARMVAHWKAWRSLPTLAQYERPSCRPGSKPKVDHIRHIRCKRNRGAVHEHRRTGVSRRAEIKRDQCDDERSSPRERPQKERRQRLVHDQRQAFFLTLPDEEILLGPAIWAHEDPVRPDPYSAYRPPFGVPEVELVVAAWTFRVRSDPGLVARRHAGHRLSLPSAGLPSQEGRLGFLWLFIRTADVGSFNRRFELDTESPSTLWAGVASGALLPMWP